MNKGDYTIAEESVQPPVFGWARPLHVARGAILPLGRYIARHGRGWIVANRRPAMESRPDGWAPGWEPRLYTNAPRNPSLRLAARRLGCPQTVPSTLEHAIRQRADQEDRLEQGRPGAAAPKRIAVYQPEGTQQPGADKADICDLPIRPTKCPMSTTFVHDDKQTCARRVLIGRPDSSNSARPTGGHSERFKG